MCPLFLVGHVLSWRKRYAWNYVFAFCACLWGLVLSTKLMAGKVCFYVFMFFWKRACGQGLSVQLSMCQPLDTPGRPLNVLFFGWESYVFMFLCEKIVPVDMALRYVLNFLCNIKFRWWLNGVGLPIASGTDCMTNVQRTSDPLLVDLPKDFDASILVIKLITTSQCSSTAFLAKKKKHQVSSSRHHHRKHHSC